MADTGNTATITFSSTGTVGNFEQIDAGEKTLPEVSDSHLSSTKETFIPGDLPNEGEVSAICHFPDAAEPALGVVETITITYPLPSGQTTNGTLAGSGFIKRYKRPVFQNNELQKCELTIKWDGKTGPTFTASS